MCASTQVQHHPPALVNELDNSMFLNAKGIHGSQHVESSPLEALAGQPYSQSRASDTRGQHLGDLPNVHHWHSIHCESF